jgi:hypothetical protein
MVLGARDLPLEPANDRRHVAAPEALQRGPEADLLLSLDVTLPAPSSASATTSSAEQRQHRIDRLRHDRGHAQLREAGRHRTSIAGASDLRRQHHGEDPKDHKPAHERAADVQRQLVAEHRERHPVVGARVFVGDGIRDEDKRRKAPELHDLPDEPPEAESHEQPQRELDADDRTELPVLLQQDDTHCHRDEVRDAQPRIDRSRGSHRRHGSRMRAAK